MLKRALFTTTALAALTASALAADLPSRRAPPPIVAVPVFTWSGFYIGGNAGYAFSTQRSEITTGLSAFNEGIVAAGGRPRFARLDQEGFTGGGQIGYNYQIGALVIGLEADAAYTDLSARRAIVTAGAVNTYRQDLNFLGTVRGPRRLRVRPPDDLRHRWSRLRRRRHPRDVLLGPDAGFGSGLHRRPRRHRHRLDGRCGCRIRPAHELQPVQLERDHAQGGSPVLRSRQPQRRHHQYRCRYRARATVRTSRPTA